MSIIQSINLALRFFLELCVLASLCYWGFVTGKGVPIQILLGIGAPLIIAFVWGTFLSPKAAIVLNGGLKIFLEVVVFGLGVVVLYAAGRHQLALVFGVIYILNRVFMYIWHQ